MQDGLVDAILGHLVCQGQPEDLAGGISSALVTTFLGLLVAIPALGAYQVFRNKATRISIDIAGILEDMTERFRNR